MASTVQKLTLPGSNRSLDYIVAGSTSPTALPFIYIHGTPSAYPVLASLSARCEKHGLKLISFSRAGYGGSTRDKGRSVVDVVGDVRALVEELGVRECVVGGWSGGGVG